MPGSVFDVVHRAREICHSLGAMDSCPAGRLDTPGQWRLAGSRPDAGRQRHGQSSIMMRLWLEPHLITTGGAETR